MRIRKVSPFLVPGALLVTLLLVPMGPGAAAPTPRESGQARTAPGTLPRADVPVGLSLGGTPAAVPTSFWGTTVSAEARLLGDEASLLNATHSRVLVWPGANAGDFVNMLNDTLMSVNGSMLSWKPVETNETAFIRVCESISCEAILQVPGEIDDPSFAAAVVNYTEKALGFYPAYWEIGNEPELWTHWKVPWRSWNLPPQNASQVITPTEYAWEVHNYTAILRTADPNIRILGLAGTGRQNGQWPLSEWINATVGLNGPDLAGIAFHVYTAGNTGALTLPQFYAFDTGTYSLPGRVESARSDISNAMNLTCPTCTDPPVFVTELGSALSHYRYANLSRGFAGGLSMAASETEALDLGVSNVDVFASIFNTSNSWIDPNGTARPDFADYAGILSHLGGSAFPVGLQVPSGAQYSGANTSLAAGLYGVATVDPLDGNRSDLLLVNENLTTNVSVAPLLPGISGGTPVELWEWSAQSYYSAANATPWVEPTTPGPTSTFLPGGLPSTWVLPPETIALFEAYPSGGAPVTFSAQGIPNGTRWFLSVNGRVSESPTTNLTLMMPAGSSSLVGLPLALPLGTFSPNPVKREASFPPSLLQVGSALQTVPVPFVAQWNLTWTISPSGAGVIAPATGWVNASAPALLTAVPRGYYLVTGWQGSGPGNYTGPGTAATVVAHGPIHENVTFGMGYFLQFVETGLPPGARWSVTVGSSSLTGVASALTVRLVNGSYAWNATGVPGYSLAPATGRATINGSDVIVTIAFSPPPGPPPTWWATNASRVYVSVGILVAVTLFVLFVNRWDRKRASSHTPHPEPKASTLPPLPQQKGAGPGTVPKTEDQPPSTSS